ncbi:MAG TPA: VOC family protein [Propionibacteriaceae bacterium]|jgi:predicted enzyme related to lactoylglutathione lyase
MTYTQIFPILSTADLPRLVDFYINAFDAVVSYRYPPQGEPGYVSLDLAGGHLGLGLDTTSAGAEVAQRAALWVYADDCDEALARLSAAGGTVLEEPADLPWGERVAKAADPDGNVIHIGQAPISE